jgi:putative membrane protein
VEGIVGISFDVGTGLSGLFFVLFFVLAIAFWGGLLALIFLGIRWLLRQSANDRRDVPSSEDTALELLRQRYARGEIDSTEYEERKRMLGG